MVSGHSHRQGAAAAAAQDRDRVHRAGLQAAWPEPGGTAQTHQALLSQFMLTGSGHKAGMLQDAGAQHDGTDAMTSQQQQQKQQGIAAGRGYRSLPSSPARTRRSDHAQQAQQQYGLLTSGAAYGQLAVSSNSPRGQAGTWGKPSASGRPSSNPAPSRGGAGSLSGSAQVGRSTSSRTPRGGGSSGGISRGSSSSAAQHKFGYSSYEQQLGDLFTATSLKAPQRYEQSPYLKSSSSSSSSSKPAQPSTSSTGLASPRSPRAKTTTVGSTGNSGAYSRQQLGALYSSSHDPVGRTKPGTASSTSSKVSSSQEGFRPSRGPGALVASSRSSTPSSATATAQFRSSTSTSSSRAATPQASLTAQKQSLHQQQQQQRLERQPTGGHQQQLSPSGPSFTQQPSQPYVSASGQFSNLLVNTSSSTVAGRPHTARGSSRAELQAADSTAAAPGASVVSNTGAAAAAGGVNLDPQSWSTFLTLSTSTSAEVRSRTPSVSGKAPQQQQQQQQQVPVAVVPRNLQAQMLSDLGLGGTTGTGPQAAGTTAAAGTPQRQPSGVALATAAQQQQQLASPAAAARPQSASGGSRGSSMLFAAAAPATERPSASTAPVCGSTQRSSGDECPPSPSAAAAAPGPLHAGLMRPRSANNVLQLAAQQSPAQQLQQSVVTATSSPQPSSYLQSLQQQQQQQQPGSPAAQVRLAGQPVTPLSALRRRSSAAEMAVAGSGGNSPMAYSAASGAGAAAFSSGPLINLNGGSSDSPGGAGSSPVPGYSFQQAWALRADEGAQVSSPRTTSVLAAQQQLLQSAGSSPAPLRRMGSSDVAAGGTPSPGPSRLQGEWGTLTAMSAFRASGYGPSLGESSAELSCSSPVCNSAGSWSSMGGTGPPAHLISSMAAAAAAAGSPTGASSLLLLLPAGASAAVGPGPSPLGIGSRPSSTTGTPHQQAAGGSFVPRQASGSGIGSFGSPCVGARRALNFAGGEGPSSPAPPAAGRAATASAAAARQEQQQQAAAADMAAVPGQQSSSAAGFYAGSRSSSFSAQSMPSGTAAGAAASVPPSQQTAIQQQHQSMEQRLNQLQQMHQAYKQQLQQAARLLDAAAGNSSTPSSPAPKQQQQQQQQATPPAATAAAAGSVDRPAAVAAAPAQAAPSLRESNSSTAATDPKAPSAARSSTTAAPGWSIPAAQQQPQQQAARPPSSPAPAQPEQQQKRRELSPVVAAGVEAAMAAAAAAAASPSRSVAPSAAAAVAAGAATTTPPPLRRPRSAAPSTAPAAPSTAPTAAVTAAPAAASGATTGSAAAPASAPAADAGAEPLLLPGYSVGAVAGEGGFCQVRLAVHHLSRRRVAVKVIDKTQLLDAAEARRMQREIRVLKRLNHPCVIRLFEVLEAGSQLLLVMEYASGGSLLDYVRGRKRLGEAEAAYFLQQILTGLQYCHDSEVVHRDIKLENILLDGNRAMKLIDFGLAAFYAPDKKLRVHCGSPSYAAPEIVARKMYEGPPVDVWSLGVVLFAMLAGCLPFHSPTGNKQELCQKIMAGTFNTPDWLSPGARDLLGRMLTVDPEARITLADAAQHPWTRSSGIVWELPTTHCYSLPSSRHASGASGASASTRSSASSSGEAGGPADGAVHTAHGQGQGQASSSGGNSVEGSIEAQASILEELEGHGYSRPAVLRYLAAAECNYITASYYLLAEARQEAAHKALPAKPWPFQPVAISSRSSGSSSRSRAASSEAAGSGRPPSGVGAAAASAQGGAPRPPSGVAAAAASVPSRPATAVVVAS